MSVAKHGASLRLYFVLAAAGKPTGLMAPILENNISALEPTRLECIG